MAVVIALSASSAFMLPIATSPSAIVSCSGYVPQKIMMRSDLLPNIRFTLLIANIGPLLSAALVCPSDMHTRHLAENTGYA